MKILFLPAYFYPEQVASSYLGANRFEAFENENIDMVVYAPTPTRGVTDDIRKKYAKKRNETMYGNKMVVHRFWLYRESKKPLFRAIRYSLQLLKHFNRAVFSHDARSADVVFLSSTPPIQGILGSMVKKCSHKKFVYCLQDIFPDSLVGTGMAKENGLLWKIGRKIEDFTYRNADRIIVISDTFKRNIMNKGVPEEKIAVIYNWVDADAITPIKRSENPLFEEFNLRRDVFTVVYAGNLGYAQNIDIILDAAARLSDVQFALFGTGGRELEIKERIKADNLSNVYLFPLQSFNRVSQVYGLGDLCVVSCKQGLGGAAMPSKTWSIMSSGRPVLASFDDGELKDIISGTSKSMLPYGACGVFTHAGNLKEFVAAIRELSKDRKRCEIMGNNARHFIEANLTKDIGTRKYVEVIRSIINRDL